MGCGSHIVFAVFHLSIFISGCVGVKDGFLQLQMTLLSTAGRTSKSLSFGSGSNKEGGGSEPAVAVAGPAPCCPEICTKL